MFATLLESRAVPQRRTGSSIASVVLHTAIIAGGVIATAHEAANGPAESRLVDVVFQQHRVPPPPPRPVAAARLTVASAPSAFRLAIPSVVPVGIPPVDLSVVATPSDFRPGPVATSGIRCYVDCASASVSDASGRELWTANDVMMRLLDAPVPPRYPEALRRAGVEGTVVVKFLVDTTGRVDMRSLEIVRSTHEGFTAAVRETVARLRFQPSITGDRKTSALAVMPFQFTLR